jgi:glycosyltransferase involved in cell wall biosynthesis
VRLVYSNSTAVLSGALVAKLTGIPHVWHVREIVERPKVAGKILRFLVLSLSCRVVTVSNAVRSWLGPTSTPVEVVYHGLSDPLLDSARRAEIREDHTEGRTGPLIGWVNRVSSWKGHEVFLEMAELAAAQMHEATFVLAGGAVPGGEHLVSHLAERVSMSPYSRQIRYLGFISDAPSLVAALDIFVSCPTRPDPFPRVVQEAVWQGVPVLAVATGGLPELVTDGIDGILVPQADPARLASALVKMAGDPPALARMGTAARATAVERYSITRYASKMERIFTEAANAGPSEPSHEVLPTGN